MVLIWRIKWSTSTKLTNVVGDATSYDIAKLQPAPFTADMFYLQYHGTLHNHLVETHVKDEVNVQRSRFLFQKGVPKKLIR